MKTAALLVLLTAAVLTSCAPIPTPNHRQPTAAPPFPSGPSATRQAYGVAREAAGVINTARTIESVF